ncbi:uncharacterized protein LOC119334044 [Triticum dicoccoides]|uniref:uncharacterized protein LOC119334044 n=1 Tax=Triticum dicoccoides TaxID=85692 RepID=UPI001891AEB1|nr:uncharacterized protein LOC119334044 [Triticum dicoccoides]
MGGGPTGVAGHVREGRGLTDVARHDGERGGPTGIAARGADGWRSDGLANRDRYGRGPTDVAGRDGERGGPAGISARGADGEDSSGIIAYGGDGGAVVPKFQYFQLFLDHKDMAFDNVMDDIHVSGTPELPLVLSPKSHGFSSGIRGSPRFKELQGSELEDSDSAEEVEVVDAQGRKKMKKKVKLKRWRPENMKEVNFHIGMMFLSVIELRVAIQEYIVKQRVQIHYIKNDKQRIRAGCVGDCPWFLFAAPDSRTKAWVVKKYVGEHTCEREWALKQFTAIYLAGKYVETFRADEKMTLQNFGRLVQLDYNMQPTRSKLARARRIALKIIHGDELEQYNLLWDFAAEIRRSNPGSTMLVHANNGKFDNCYMSLDACKRGFLLACRPIICIDGCHIKNKYGGVMLTAVGVDPNDCIFPIAIAIVEVEDTVTWKWFLNTLKEDLNIQNTAPWTLMSDRQKGLINAVNAMFPDAQHRFCVRHLHQNFAKNWKGDVFKNKLWQIARATHEADWKKYMQEMKELDQGAYEYLDAIDPRQWCKAYFHELPKCDLLLNNSCEVFNKYILDAREMPIVTCLKKIKDQLMTRFYSKNLESEEMCGQICPKIRKKTGQKY